MRKMIFATGNENKMVEIREILGDLPLEIQSLKEAGVYADVVEDGSTFEGECPDTRPVPSVSWRARWYLLMIPAWKLII